MKFDLAHVLNSALDGIFIIARDGRVVLFNHACEDLYGVSEADFVQKACWRFSDFEIDFDERSGKGSLPYGEIAGNKERLTLTHKNGREVWVETIYTPIFDPQSGEIAYVMGVIKDITELKKIEREKDHLEEELDLIRRELETKYDFSSIAGRSPKTMEVLKLAAEVAKQNTTVILLGESGTGKELLAKAIHYNSPRASRAFVAVNCSAFPDTLIESELFGYEKGAFTGADKYKPGKAELASGGTLFLDEVTELSSPAQAKILRLIQEREFEPLGSVKPRRADIRIIAATNKDPEKLVREGRFREDLYYRLFVYPIVIHPLRERRQDLPILIDCFLRKLNREMGKNKTGISPRAMKVLLNYSWPGNVRELQNVMERMMILSRGKTIEVADLPGYMMEDSLKNPNLKMLDSLPQGFSLERYIEDLEANVILQTLKKCRYNKTRAAQLLGLTRSTLRYKLSKLTAREPGGIRQVNTTGTVAEGA